MNVKELREKAGLTQQELATKSGIPKDRIAKWEQGKGAPKSKDSKILGDIFMELLPREKNELELNEPEVPYTKPDVTNETILQAIVRLAESNQKIIDSNAGVMLNSKLVAETNKVLANSHSELVELLKQKSIAHELHLIKEPGKKNGNHN